MGTIRQRMKELLCDGDWNGIELSQALSIEERLVYEHLHHVKKSLVQGKGRFVVQPYQCQSCDYTFKSRDRLDRPGRCPMCRNSHIAMARFSITV